MSSGMPGMNPYGNNPMNRMNPSTYGGQSGGMPGGMPGAMQGYGHMNPMNRMPGMHPNMGHPNMNSMTTQHMRTQYMVSNKKVIIYD